jgi:hypothetical protein
MSALSQMFALMASQSAAPNRAELQFEGPDGSTSIIDASGKLWTPHGAAKISTAKFSAGASSLYLNGSAGTYVSSASEADFGFGTGDFKISFDVYPVDNNRTMLSIGGTGQYLAWYISATNAPTIYDGTTSYVSTGTGIPLNTWTAIEVGKTAGVVYIKVNGATARAQTITTSMGSSRTIFLGSDSAGSSNFNGYIDKFIVHP